jgi:hypothetical protein
MGDVIQFNPIDIGDDYKFDPDEILEKAKGQGFTNVAIIGELPDGSTWLSGAASSAETIMLMERAKLMLLGFTTLYEG